MEIFDEIINVLDKIENELGYYISNQDIDYEKYVISCSISTDEIYIIISYLDDIEIFINNNLMFNNINDLYSYYVAEKFE